MKQWLQWWKREGLKYLLFIVLVTLYGSLYGSWWSSIPAILVFWWWIDLTDKVEFYRRKAERK